MQKKCIHHQFLSKIVRISYIQVILVLSCFGTATAIDTKAQDHLSKKVRLQAKEWEIRKVLQEIEKQTDVSFVFSSKMIEAKRKIAFEANDVPMSRVLEQLLIPMGVSYEISGKLIILSKKEAPSLPPPAPEADNTPVPVDRWITGTVKDEAGAPLPGVNILVKGTQQGTTSDSGGKFRLSIGDGENTLVFSFVGYITREVTVTTETSLDLALREDEKALDEVVVVGYGTKSKSTLTGSVSTINEEALAGRPTARTTDLIQGLAPGVQITRSNAGRIRGTNSAITIRGISSRSNPGVLIIIDGIMQSENNTYALDNINPADIESISILKDAQAAIYGARAAGGVMLITTKSGKSDKPTIDFSAAYNIQKPSLLRKSTNILQLVEMMNQSFVNDGQVTNMYTHIADYIRSNNLTMDEIRRNDGRHVVRWPFDNSSNLVFGHYDWHDIMFGAAPMQTYNLSVSGRTDRFNYFNSIGYVDQVSMLNHGENKNKRLFIRLKNDMDVTRNFQVKTNFSLERQRVTEPYQYETMQVWEGIVWPTHMPYTAKGNLYNYGSIQNPIGMVERSGSVRDIYYRLKSQIGLVLKPFKGMTVTGQTALNYDILENEWASLGFDMYNENDVFTYNSTANRNTAGANYQRTRYAMASLYADYKFRISHDHAFTLLGGYSHEEQDFRTFAAERRLGLITPDLPSFGLGSSTEQYNSENKNDRALRSAFAKLDYSFKNKYLAELTYRYDGSSRFSRGNQWMPFYGVSGAWVISQENFMKSLKGVDFLKVRASWGLLGNESSIGLYDYISTITIGGSYPMGNPNSPSITQNASLTSLASQTRSWETILTKNLGIDFAALNSRLSGTVDFFTKTNNDMFYISEFPQVLGITAPSINGARVKTKGWELSLKWADRIGAFSYFVGGNLSDNKSRVIELADSRIPVQGVNNFVEGYPVGALFGYRFDGLIQDEAALSAYTSQFRSGIPINLKPGDARYKDLDGDGALRPQVYQTGADGKPTANSGDMEYLGDMAQHYLYGISLGANYKQFDFSAFLQGVLSWNVQDLNTASTGNVVAPLQYFYGKQWTPDNAANAVYPRLTQTNAIILYDYAVSDAPYRLYNSRYMRLKNIQVGYTLPDHLVSRLKVQKLRVYFSGTDLFEFHNLPGINDPEKPFTDRQFNPVPFPRTYSFGLNLTF